MSESHASSSLTETLLLTKQVPMEHFNRRLDQCLADLFPEYSRSKCKVWIESGAVSVDGSIQRVPRTSMKGGERVMIEAEIQPAIDAHPEKFDLHPVFEDEHLLVINKPRGLVVHPGSGNHSGTLLNGLLHYHPASSQLPRAGIVHRLDKDTTGLMVVAKTALAHTSLINQLQDRSMGREYEAVVMGAMVAGGMVDEPIERHPTKRTLMSVVWNGKEAVTHYRIIEKFRQHTHLRLKLETGRTHQIRVHMSHLKHPLVGDVAYGGRVRLPKSASQQLQQCLRGFDRQALHAAQLTLLHPVNNEEMTWQAELPTDLIELLSLLRADTLINGIDD